MNEYIFLIARIFLFVIVVYVVGHVVVVLEEILEELKKLNRGDD